MEISPIDHGDDSVQSFSHSTCCCMTHKSHLTCVSQPQVLATNDDYHSQNFCERKGEMTGVEYRVL